MSRTILIIGASSEVGFHFIKKEAMSFDHIIAHYCHESEELEQLKKEFGEKIELVQADFTSYGSTKLMTEKIKNSSNLPEYILHLPSAKYHNNKFHKSSWDIFNKNLEIQVRSITLVLQELLPHMLRKKFGRIVFLLSSCTEGTAPKYLTDYVMAKYALLGLMRSLASEYAGKGITINAVSPGMMETKLLSEITELVIEQNAMSNPYGRNIKIEDILPSVSFLLSEKNNMLTGQNLLITGGKQGN